MPMNEERQNQLVQQAMLLAHDPEALSEWFEGLSQTDQALFDTWMGNVKQAFQLFAQRCVEIFDAIAEALKPVMDAIRELAERVETTIRIVWYRRLIEKGYSEEFSWYASHVWLASEMIWGLFKTGPPAGEGA